MNQEKKWICILKTKNSFEAEVTKGNLEAQDIPAVIWNKRDSSYLDFGYIEIHVPEDLEIVAKAVMDEHKHQN